MLALLNLNTLVTSRFNVTKYRPRRFSKPPRSWLSSWSKTQKFDGRSQRNRSHDRPIDQNPSRQIPQKHQSKIQNLKSKIDPCQVTDRWKVGEWWEIRAITKFKKWLGLWCATVHKSLREKRDPKHTKNSNHPGTGNSPAREFFMSALGSNI